MDQKTDAENLTSDTPRDAGLLRSDAAGIATLTLNRPQQRNSLSKALLVALQDTLDAIAADKSVRCVVIAANGPGFCAGHDLKEMTAHREDEDGGLAYFKDLLARCSAMMQSIIALPQPVIAKVHANATAAGCQLVATCDIAIAGQSASFGVNGINSGLFCSTPMVALSRKVAPSHALEMLMLGTMIDADRAHRIGLVSRTVRDDELNRSVAEVAQALASKSAAVLALGKQAFYRQLPMPLDKAYDYTGGVIVENLLLDDAREGICAFIEKRRPVWKDR